jgi:hypothetical protein
MSTDGVAGALPFRSAIREADAFVVQCPAIIAGDIATVGDAGALSVKD